MWQNVQAEQFVKRARFLSSAGHLNYVVLSKFHAVTVSPWFQETQFY